MNEQKMKSGAIVAMVLSLVAVCGAVTPNYVKTTVYGAVNDPAPVISYSYSDGLGRSIESQTLLPGGKSIVSGTYYDAAGRPYKSPKPYVVNQQSYVDYSTSTNVENLIVGANTYYNGTGGIINAGGKAYSETRYYNDPLGRVRTSGAPGVEFALGAGHEPKTWHLKVVTKATSEFIPLTSNEDLDTTTLNTKEGTPVPGAQYFLTVSMDPNGHFSQEMKDIFGRVVATWAQKPDPNADDIVARYDYDALGNLIQETSPGGLIASYQYNTLGQVTQKTTPDAGTVLYYYDIAGRLSKTITANNDLSGVSPIYGIMYENTYDDFGRIIRTSRVLAYGSLPLIETYYDKIPDDIQIFTKNGIDQGILLSLTNIKGRSFAAVYYNRISCDPNDALKNIVIDLYSYDDEGHLINRYKAIPGLPVQTFAYEYDFAGKLKKEIAPNGVPREYTYDAMQRLQTVAMHNKQIAGYDYFDVGLLHNVNLKNPQTGSVAVRNSYLYTVRDWLREISFTKPNSAYSNFSEFLLYSENTGDNVPQFNGNISVAGQKLMAEGASVVIKSWDFRYTYDNANRLLKVTEGPSGAREYNEAFAYDNNGRIVKKQKGNDDINSSNQMYTYKSGTNQLTHITNSIRDKLTSGNGNYVYDNNGNMVVDRSKKMTIEYDWRDMPVAFRFYSQIPDPVGTQDIDWKVIAGNRFSQVYPDSKLISEVRMLYDASGNRVLKTTCVPIANGGLR